VGKLFLMHLEQAPPTAAWATGEAVARQAAVLRKIVGPPAAFVWWALWPVRSALR